MVRLSHLLHLRMAWQLLHRFPVGEAAAALGAVLPELYADEQPPRHIFKPDGTLAWVQAVHSGMALGESFEAFLERNPHLLRLDGATFKL